MADSLSTQGERTLAERTVSDPAEPIGTTDLAGTGAPLVEEELLVEEVSIDGMCGVY
jgi:mycofactocin precursor